jgi:prepilin-type N-terminal cleavage/methylation domain-containing protein
MSKQPNSRVKQRAWKKSSSSFAAVRRGYTLVELMAVVVIVGILATLAIFSLRRYVFAARSSEATQMIGSIKVAQENYKDETFRYRDVSGDLDTYYPSATPGSHKTGWGDTSTPLGQNWAELGVSPSGPVVFGYACIAGQGGEAIPGTALSDDIDWPATTSPWYVVQAIADQNDNDILAVYVSSSFSDQIFFENEDE